MTTLRELSYMIDANTDGLNKALPSLEKLATSLERLGKDVQSLSKSFSTGMNSVGQAATQQANVVARSSTKAVTAMKKQEAAMVSAASRVKGLNEAIRKSGAPSRLLASTTRAYNVLEKQLKSTSLTSEEAAKHKAKFAATLSTVRRELTSYNAAQRLTMQTQKAGDAALLKQENTLEKVRIKYLDLQNALNLQGAKSERIAALNNEFEAFEASMTSGTLSAREFSAANNRIASEMGKVKRNEGFTDISSKMTDLAKSAQVALGPLSGVASRITAITSLANRNNIAIAGVIGGMIAFGTSMASAIRRGALLEQAMLRINAVLAVTGNRIGLSSSQIEKSIVRVASATMATEGQVREAAASLLTFENVGKEVYESALMAAQGLALLARGDINSQIRNIGRTLNDPINNLNSLSESGVVFNAVEREKIKLLQMSGDLLGAQEAVMERVNIVTEAAKGEAQGLMGAWSDMVDTFDTFLGTAGMSGGAVSSLTAILRDLNTRFKDLNNSVLLGTGISRAYKVVVDTLGGALVFAVTHLDKFVAAMIGFIALKAVLSMVAFARGIWAVVVAMRALATASALATGGITLAAGAISIALAAIGEKLYDSLSDGDDEVQRMLGSLKDIESQFKNVGEASEDYTERFRSAMNKAAEMLRDKELNKEVDLKFTGMDLEIASDMFRAGDIKGAVELLEEITGGAKTAGASIDGMSNRVRFMADQWAIMRDQHLGFIGALKEQEATLKQIDDNWTDLVAALMAFGASASEAEAQLKLLRNEVEKNGSATSQFTTGLEKSIVTMRSELAISKATGAAKRKLKDEQALLNQLWASGLVTSANYTEVLKMLKEGGFDPLIDSIRQLTDEMNQLEYAQMVQGMNNELRDSLQLMEAELALAGKSEYEKAKGLDLIRQKQAMVNAGIAAGTAEWNSMLAAVERMVDLDFTRGHMEAMKTLRDEAEMQDAVLQSLFYSERTRERMIALQEKEMELARKYGSLMDERAQKELQVFKQLQVRDEVVKDWQEIADAAKDAFKGLEDELVSFAKTGEFNWKKLASSILEDIFRITYQATIARPLQDWLGNLMGDKPGKGNGGNPAAPTIKDIFGELGSTPANPMYVMDISGDGMLPGMPSLGDMLNPSGPGGGNPLSKLFSAPVGDVIRKPLADIGKSATTLTDKLDRIALPTDYIQTRIDDAFGTIDPGYIQTRIDDAFGALGPASAFDPNIGSALKDLNSSVSDMARTVTDTVNPQNFSRMINLSQKDMTDITKLISTEVHPNLSPADYNAQAGGVFDTVINRVRSPAFPNNVQDVINQRMQFSKINGPAKLNPYGNVDNMPWSDVNPMAESATWGHAANRAAGMPSSVGGHLNYLNPAFSDPGPLKQWGNSVAGQGGPTFGSGNMQHLHGTAPGLTPAAQDFGITAPGMPGGLGGMGGGEAGLGGGLTELSQSVTQANSSFMQLGEQMPQITTDLTGGLEKAAQSAGDLADNGLNRAASGMESLADNAIQETIQSQIQSAATTQQMGTQSMVTSAQITQLGSAAMAASAQMGASGVGGLFLHGGGIVGSGGAMASVGGSFAGAPRLHGGLHPNEFRAVLERGEGVFTKEQMAALGNAVNSRGEAEGEGGGTGMRRPSGGVTVNMHGVKDFDSFRKSEAQMRASVSSAQQQANWRQA